jgi:hypothetical protein
MLTGLSQAKKGMKEYMSDPMSAVTDVSAALKTSIAGSPLEGPSKQLAAAAGMDDGLVVLAVVLVTGLLTVSIFGATNIVCVCVCAAGGGGRRQGGTTGGRVATIWQGVCG